jgi:hypothetical protein
VAPPTQPTLHHLTGVWTRSLLLWEDGRRDEASDVTWLQGPSWYVDLRQPADSSDFRGMTGLRGITCLRDLGPPQLAWLATQEGFAGRLRHEEDAFEWRRVVDLQPPSPVPDAGRLRFDDGQLIEEGRDQPYVEHWQLTGHPAYPTAGGWLRDRATGQMAVLVRVGDRFGYARGRNAVLPVGTTLAELVLGAGSARERQELVDCEISLGTVGTRHWVVDRSSLPYRRGHALDPVLGDAHRMTTVDVTPVGEPMVRTWDVLVMEGELAAFNRAHSRRPVPQHPSISPTAEAST